jgi:hypothetical protein
LSVVAVAESPLYEALRLIGVNVVKPPEEPGKLLDLVSRGKVLVVKSLVCRRLRGELEGVLARLAVPPLLVVALLPLAQGAGIADAEVAFAKTAATGGAEVVN